jgi:hypothetical protein
LLTVPLWKIEEGLDIFEVSLKGALITTAVA